MRTSTNTLKKNHESNELLEHFTDAESSGNESQRAADLQISTPIERDQSLKPEDNLSVLTDKLDTLQKFFLTEISDIKAETKNKSLQNVTKEDSIDSDGKNELLEKQINFLREECDSKNQLTNVLLEIIFKIDIPKICSSKNNNTIANNINDDYQFPQKLDSNNNKKSPHNHQIGNNQVHALSVNEDNHIEAITGTGQVKKT